MIWVNYQAIIQTLVALHQWQRWTHYCNQASLKGKQKVVWIWKSLTQWTKDWKQTYSQNCSEGKHCMKVEQAEVIPNMRTVSQIVRIMKLMKKLHSWRKETVIRKCKSHHFRFWNQTTVSKSKKSFLLTLLGPKTWKRSTQLCHVWSLIIPSWLLLFPRKMIRKCSSKCIIWRHMRWHLKNL